MTIINKDILARDNDNRILKAINNDLMLIINAKIYKHYSIQLFY
jgi:hypothetical protein